MRDRFFELFIDCGNGDSAVEEMIRENSSFKLAFQRVGPLKRRTERSRVFEIHRDADLVRVFVSEKDGMEDLLVIHIKSDCLEVELGLASLVHDALCKLGCRGQDKSGRSGGFRNYCENIRGKASPGSETEFGTG